MMAFLTRNWDPIRAYELVDFLLLFLLLVAAVTTILSFAHRARARKLHQELERSSEEVYYNLLPSLSLSAKEHGLLKRLAAHLTPPQQRHRLVTNPQVFAVCAARFLRDQAGEGPAVARLQRKLGFRPAQSGELPGSTPDLPKYMRRAHLRQQLRLPVAVRLLAGTAKPVQSVLIDLSGGGASLRNPDTRFKAQEQLELTFAPDSKKLTVPAQVLRTSQNGAVLHVRFKGLSPPSRERIVLLLRRIRDR